MAAALQQVRAEVEAVKLREVAVSGERREDCEEEVDETSTDGGAMSGIPSCAASESGDDQQLVSSAPESKTQSEDEEDEEDDDDDEDDEDDDDEDEEETEEERIARIEALKAGPLPSVGSVGHFSGECSRCCFFPKGRCQNGYDCPFCHFDHEKRIRKKKKKSKKAKRAAKRAEAAKAAAAAATAAAAVVATADLSRNCWNSSSQWPWPQSFPEAASLGLQQQPTYESFEEDLSHTGQISEGQRQSLDVSSDDIAFSRKKLRARGAQVLENIMGLAGPPNAANSFPPHMTENVVPTSISQVPCGAPLWYHADMAVIPVVAFGPAAVPVPPLPHGAFLAATQVPPPPGLTETPLTPTPTPAPAPLPEEEEAAAVLRKSEAKTKEFPSEALFGAPEKVKVEIKENIRPIPFRPVPVKVTIPVSELVTPIPPRPVPVKLRVSEPGPSPAPLCLEEVLAKLGELQCARGCSVLKETVGEGGPETAPELVPAN